MHVLFLFKLFRSAVVLIRLNLKNIYFYYLIKLDSFIRQLSKSHIHLNWINILFFKFEFCQIFQVYSYFFIKLYKLRHLFA